MRMRSILGALSIIALSVTPVFAEESLEERVKRLEEALKQSQERESREVHVERSSSPATQYPTPTGAITDIKVERKGEEKIPLGFGSTGSGKLIYAKPFLSAPKATVGGYADVMYNNLSRQNLDNPSRNTFGQQRMVPFIYADITDHIKFATEIELERGGTNAPQGSDGSMQLEFAQIDYLLTEAVNIRAGILLMPVGKFNLLHDSPLNDLVDRPMVSRIVIPSTWFEAGAGIYGTLYPSSLSKLDYEIYAVNGMSQTAGAITDAGVRSARGSVSRDRDDNKAIVGRVAFSPRLGIEVAGSGYHGTYKPSAGAVGTGRISIFALDWTLQRGPFEIIGESAWSRISNNNATGVTGSGIGPAGMHGYYLQGNYHFMPEFLKKWAPSHFSDASTFTAVIRWEQVDTDTDNRTSNAPNTVGNRRELERLTLGLNFRPIEDTVFKFDWQFNTQKDARGLVNAGDMGTANSPMNGNGFLIQAATYF
ncbi:MAG: OprO/OprP family phosphate-selective porin [Nitrospira sp. BO4]|nr:OprO/OprP family phosphate-selective porin [Nitrospira sp. BO4]